MGRMFAIVACLILAACTTTDVKLADKAAPKPAAGSKVLIVQPDIELSLLTAAGLQEAKADWSDQGRANISASLKSATQGRSHVFRELDPATARQGRVGQLLRLHEAVGQSIMAFNYGAVSLPSKNGAFDWTLGDGAKALGDTYDADYALFTYGRGSYSSGGRKAMMIGMAALGVSIPMGGQQMFASLVDLRTGRIVWFNVANAASSADMRSPEGAAALVASLLKDAPL